MDVRYGRVKWGPSGTRVKTSPSNWRNPLKWDKWARTGVCYYCHGKSLKDTPGKCPVCSGTGNIGPYRARVFCASLADGCEEWRGPMLSHDLKNPQQLFTCSECGEFTALEGESLWEQAEDEDGQNVFLCHGKNTHKTIRVRPTTMDDLRARLWPIVKQTTNLDWLMLTKRADRIGLVPHYPNVWMGVTIEGDGFKDGHGTVVDRWYDHLSQANQFAVRWISYEPALSRLDISKWETVPDWIIIGGESNQSNPARPFDIEWCREAVRQCRGRGVVPFVKQLGSHVIDPGATAAHSFPETQCWPPNTKVNVQRILLKDRAGADPSEWPADLRVREFPDAMVPA